MTLYFLGCDSEDIESNMSFQNEINRLGGVQVLQSLWCFNADGVRVEDVRARFMRLLTPESKIMVVESGLWSSKSALNSPNSARQLEYVTASVSA